MKKITFILTFTFILLVFSCGQNSFEKELNGNWREIENEYSTWHFYPDSIIFKIYGVRQEKVDWNANKSQIKFEHQTFYLDSLVKRVDTINRIQIDYQLSSKKDSLFGTLKNNYGVHEFSMLKTENYLEYLNRKFGIGFILPKNDSIETTNIDPVYGMKVFMTEDTNKIIGKTELSNSLNNLEIDIKKFKAKLETYFGTYDFRTERFYLSVYADKQISDSIITANLAVTLKSDFYLKNTHNSIPIPRPPGDSLPITIYRMYSNGNNDNLDLRKAKKIRTTAYTVYN